MSVRVPFPRWVSPCITRGRDWSTAPCEAAFQGHGTHLCQSDDVEGTGIFAVELGQLTKEAAQPSVVGAGPDDPHGEDGAVGHLRVAVVGELAEGVHDAQVRVGHRHQAQRQGD